jgi:threonine dehydrogenase-like Zn-dependent dehydrogenase
MTPDPAQNIDILRKASPTGDGYDVVVEATGVIAVGDICLPLTRNGGTVLVYGVTRPDDRLSVSPFEMFRRDITIKGSYAEMTSFAAAIAAQRTGRVRTDGIITHRFPLEDYGKALDTLASDTTAHKGVYQINGGSDLVGDHLVGIRPSNVTANALRAGFHLVAHRALPLPVGSSDRVVR